MVDAVVAALMNGGDVRAKSIKQAGPKCCQPDTYIVAHCVAVHVCVCVSQRGRGHDTTNPGCAHMMQADWDIDKNENSKAPRTTFAQS